MHLMRMPLPGAGDEPIGKRIIELPQDPAGAESRDPHSGFIAYVPKGSIAKGKEFVTTAATEKRFNARFATAHRSAAWPKFPRLPGILRCTCSASSTISRTVRGMGPWAR